jgi:hypothetical protein
MKTKLIILFLLLVVTHSLFAGRYAGDFMSIGAGVRALGMGGAYASIAEDGSTIYWNASGIGQIRQSEVTMMHAYLYNGLATYDNMTFCQPLPNEVTIGINWTRLQIDKIPYFDEKWLVGTNVDQRSANPQYQLPGVPDKEFASVDDLFQFAFSKHVFYKANMGWQFFEIPFDFYFGGNVKFIKRAMLEQLGTGTGFDLSFKTTTDLSVIFDQDWMGKLNFGINFQDVSGTDITWDVASNHKDQVLFNTKWGVSATQPFPFIKSQILLAIDTDYAYQIVRHYGAEFQYHKIAAIRMGYYDGNFSTGMSFKLYGFNVDYGFITNPLGSTNRVGLRFNF